MPVYTTRHSSSPRKSTTGEDVEARRAGREHMVGDQHHAGSNLTKDEAERLAEKIAQVGSEYIAAKTEARYKETEVPQGDAAVAAGADPAAVANKLMKEAAREMERHEGHIHGHTQQGSDAALAQSVVHWKDDPKAPEHQVASRVREKVAHAQETYVHPQAEGVNPDAGRDRNDTRIRHYRTLPSWDHVTATTRTEGRNPDVLHD